MIVSEHNVQTALTFLADDPHPLAVALYNVAKAENHRKEAYARALLAASGTADVRKATAEVSDEYMEAKQREADAIFEVERFKSRKNAAENLIEVWRTENANIRAAERIR